MNRKIILSVSLMLTTIMIVAFFSYELGKGTGFTGEFEDLPFYSGFPSTCSYVIDTNNTHYVSYEGRTGTSTSPTADDETLIQGRINLVNLVGGGIVYLKDGTYSCSLTVKANVLLLLEPGVTGVTYTVNSGGYCMRYSGGYAYFEHPLNMTGHQLLFGAFHTGNSAPSAISTGQWWYDTSSYTLKVYNGTGWEQVQGGTGPTGPAGKVEGADYKFMVFRNTTSTYLLNGDTGAIDDYNNDNDTVINWAIGNLTSGRVVCEKVVLKGEFLIDNAIDILATDNYTILEGAGAKIIREPTDTDNTTTRMLNIEYASHVYIRNIEFDGNSYNNVVSGLYLFEMTSVKDFEISGCQIHNVSRGQGEGNRRGWGILMYSCERGLIHDNEIYETGKSGCDADVGCKNICISNNIFWENDQSGNGNACGIDGNNNMIANNVFFENENYEHPAISLGRLNHSLITGNVINGSSSESNNWGIRLGANTHGSTGYWNIISDNVVWNVGYGILLYGSDYNLISNNYIYHTKGSYGIRLDEISADNDGSENNRVIGNYIYDTAGYGIDIRNECHFNDISDNTVLWATTYGIWVGYNCDNGTLSGNKVRNSGTGIRVSITGGNCDYWMIHGNDLRGNTNGLVDSPGTSFKRDNLDDSGWIAES